MKHHRILLGMIMPALIMFQADGVASGGTATANPSMTAAELGQMNFGVLIDKSTSMTWKVGGTGTCKDMSRWAYAIQKTKGFLQGILEVDPTGGIEVGFCNDTPFSAANVIICKTPDDIDAAFAANQPAGGGPELAPALQHFFGIAKKSYEEGRNYQLYVITDGGASDKAAVKNTIRAQATITNQKEDSMFNIGFFQIGYQDDATKFLQDLDDGIAEVGKIHDIVNTMNVDNLEGYSLGEVAHLTAND